MTVKGNMPALYRQLKKLPWARIPATSSVSKGHGRRARRTIKVALAPAWIGFAGAAQVAQLRRTVTKKGKKTVEVVYLITSDRAAEPAALAAWVRGHWHIENKLHRAASATTFHDPRPRCGYRLGLLGLEAAVELLIGHGAWLARADFAARPDVRPRWHTGAEMMSVDLEAALAAGGRAACRARRRGAGPGAGGEHRGQGAGRAG